MAGSWGCPHEVNDRCTKINNLPCNPGMKGCELAGRYRFVDESKNERYWEKKAREKASIFSAAEKRHTWLPSPAPAETD
jgi:hypothetical protein